MTLTSKFKNYINKLLNILVRSYFHLLINKKKFCIISNDCWGAEMYKLLNRPFNTPFIGLMLMSPCYLNLLKSPQYYLSLPLYFKKTSKYPSMQKKNAGIAFPVGVLGNSDIEIHFLHYKIEEVAREKWEKRVKRIDWDNLFVKYDCGKDYADIESVDNFLGLPYSNKLIFGKEDFGRKDILVLKKYSLDAVVQFRNCFLSFNPVGWIDKKVVITNRIQRFICSMAFKYI